MKWAQRRLQNVRLFFKAEARYSGRCSGTVSDHQPVLHTLRRWILSTVQSTVQSTHRCSFHTIHHTFHCMVTCVSTVSSLYTCGQRHMRVCTRHPPVLSMAGHTVNPVQIRAETFRLAHKAPGGWGPRVLFTPSGTHRNLSQSCASVVATAEQCAVGCPTRHAREVLEACMGLRMCIRLCTVVATGGVNPRGCQLQQCARSLLPSLPSRSSTTRPHCDTFCRRLPGECPRSRSPGWESLLDASVTQALF